MKPLNLATAFRRAYDACIEESRDGAAINRHDLTRQMALYVEKEYAEVVRASTTEMLFREAQRAIKARHHRSRPSALEIRRGSAIASGQLPLPTLAEAATEMYDLSDGRTVALVDLTLVDLTDIIRERQKRLAEETDILRRIEWICDEMDRRGVTTVRELLSA